jgi:D-beta-D-heptose 7-phosphate kinase/D-beta-D-heptose 1-phosphate adenosyltransferase
LNINSVLIKLDRDGIFLFETGERGQLFATRRREVCDVTGAGDMVLAVMGLCAASGLSCEYAVQLANLAAGVEVDKLGVVPVTKGEIQLEFAKTLAKPALKLVSLKDMVCLARDYHRQGKSLVFTNGCFDILHVGQITCLNEAATLGDILVVAVNSDQSVQRLKGVNRLSISERDRAAMIAALDSVDHVLIFQEDTPIELLRQLQPDVLVKGGTYSTEQISEREFVESYGGKVCITSYVSGAFTPSVLPAIQKLPGASLR